MASTHAGVLFSVRINGLWRQTPASTPAHHEPAAVARDHLRRQIAAVLRRGCVLDLAAAEDAVNAAIGTWSSPVKGLEVTGTVRLDTTSDDRALAQEHIRRQQVAGLAHQAELDRLAHLQAILADRDLRRVWWIAQFPGRFSECDALQEVLQDLLLPHEAEEDGIRSDIRRFTDQLLADLHTPQQRDLFLTALIQTLTVLGHGELATAAAHFQSQPAPGGETA
ncbi:hypothetical protein [Streptomyces longwoodensis]|uniref:hypothetical protein n=1 Tax=Streptomyces longwoodensis TaxID=68231 RepID=UPI00340ACAB5